MAGLFEPDGSAYTLEVGRISHGWKWQAWRIPNNSLFANGSGTAKTRKEAIEKGKEHIFSQEQAFWDRTAPLQKVKV